MRLIDADVLKEEICKRYMHFSRRVLTLYPVFEEIKKAPSLDAVLVTRCKDCKHRPEIVEESDEYDMDTYLEFPDEVCPCQCDDYYYSWMPKDDWFCASGERKEK